MNADLLHSNFAFRAPGEAPLMLDLYGAWDRAYDEITICEVRLAGHGVNIISRFSDTELARIEIELKRGAVKARQAAQVENAISMALVGA